MIGPSKILTVSYGTFSCTLEGFDDPFNTMKAIAEYFRDLAAGDRYFGAEPPIPDAAMLHKIAEREIHRRVEAKIQENGVILRTGDAMSPAAQIAAPAVAEAPAMAPAPQPVVAAPVAAAPVSAAPVAAAPVAAVRVAPSVAAEAPAGVETAAQRLSRLRAAQIVEPARVVATPAAPAFADLSAYGEDQDDEGVSAPVVAAEPAAAVAAVEAAPEADAPEDAMAEEDLAEQDLAAQVLAEQDLAGEDLSGEDLADLRAMDGVDGADLTLAEVVEVAAAEEMIEDLDQPLAAFVDVAEADADLIDLADQVSDATEAAAPDLEIIADVTEAVDQTAKAAAPADEWLDSESLTGEVIDDADQDLSFVGATADDRADLAPDEADFDGAEADDLSDTILAALASQTSPNATTAEVTDDLEDDGFDLSAAVNDSIAASLAQAADAETLEEAEAQDDLAQPELSEPEAAAVAPAPLPEQPAAAGVAAAPAPELGEKIQRARARVIKIRRADAPSVVIGRASAAAVAPPVDVVANAQPVGGLSVDAETALQSELAALDLRLDPGAEAALLAALDTTGVPEPVSAPSTDISTPEPVAVAGIDAVDRLMAETNSHLQVPETKRRQSAIAHLKAAVAATIADRLSNPSAVAKQAEARLHPYRKDLEQAVSPAYPGEAMGADRPAPLVLVSSQRIDRPKPAAPTASPAPRVVQPVRPRRVTSGAPQLRPMSLVGDDAADEIGAETETAENIFAASSAQSFPEFAERLGVSTVPDLLEAAAAYCALVLGREQFSRPLLLETVARLPGSEDTSLEDSLRGFGTLLRDGRITKVRRGQFQLAEDSHVLTEARRFAG